ncbi:MAG: ABC transporter permease [Chloroflexi bacterium]|nr:ABC transporter permease [Chloroflexota bacterium]
MAEEAIVARDTADAGLALPKPMPYLGQVWWRFRKDKMGLATSLVILLIILSAILAPWISPYDPNEGLVSRRLAPLFADGHILGTDEQGRDMLTRLLYGGRNSLLAGVVPVVMAFTVGTTLGILAGYGSQKVNTLIMRVTDVFYAFPSILLAIAIAGALGPGLKNVLIALMVVNTPRIVRIAESVTVQAKGLDYVEAARASGAGMLPIIRSHILPNVVSPLLVYNSTLVSVNIIAAAGLGFLGLGIASPHAEWGAMLNTLRQSIYMNVWVPILPGAAIFITSMAFNLLSDSVRDAMDVRL